MAEWSIAAVLKTVELRGSGGSNPSLSAKLPELLKYFERQVLSLWKQMSVEGLKTLIFCPKSLHLHPDSFHTGVAQLVEHRSPKPSVGRSSRSSRASSRIFAAFLF